MKVEMTKEMAEAKAKVIELSTHFIEKEMTGTWYCDAGFPLAPALIIHSDYMEDGKDDESGEQFKAHVITIEVHSLLVPILSTKLTISRLIDDAALENHFDVAIAEIKDRIFEAPIPLELLHENAQIAELITSAVKTAMSAPYLRKYEKK